MGKIRAVIFDLDDVLHNEQNYLFAAYREIADFLSLRSSLSKEELYDRLVASWREKTGMYPRLFNDFVAEIGLGQEFVPEILRIYANVNPSLSLYPGVEESLSSLRHRGIRLGLLTNGTVVIQRNKVRLLGVSRFFDEVVYAREACNGVEKPKSEPYSVILERMGVSPAEAVCVGDNPYTDFSGARQIGMRTVRVLIGEFRNVKIDAKYEADVEANSLDEAFEIIRRLASD